MTLEALALSETQAVQGLKVTLGLKAMLGRLGLLGLTVVLAPQEKAEILALLVLQVLKVTLDLRAL